MVKTHRKTKNTGVNTAARCSEVLSHCAELRLNFEEAELRRFPVNTCKYETSGSLRRTFSQTRRFLDSQRGFVDNYSCEPSEK